MHFKGKNFSEVIDLGSNPIDPEVIIQSVRKLKTLVLDGWKTCGMAGGFSVTEHLSRYIEDCAKRLTLPDAPAPSSRSLKRILLRFQIFYLIKNFF